MSGFYFLNIKVLLFALIFLTLVTSLSPFFVSTFAGYYQAGSKILQTSAPTTSGGISAQNTTVTYLNTYTATPSFTYSISFLNSYWNTTPLFTDIFFDLTMPINTTTSRTLQLKYTQSTILQLGINYIVVVFNQGIYLNANTSYTYLEGYSTINTTIQGGTRSINLNITYFRKLNLNAARCVYNTIGLGMMRSSNNFQFTLSNPIFFEKYFLLSLTVMPNNGLRFIRISFLDFQDGYLYQWPVNQYFDMGFIILSSDTVPDSSGLNFVETGAIFVGLSDWAINDANSTFNLNITLSSRTLNFITNSLTRFKSSYVWYRTQSCLIRYYNDAHVCYACHYSCYTCSSTTNDTCLTCLAADNRTLDTVNFNSCPCNSNTKQTGISTCVPIICNLNICVTCSDDNICILCQSNVNRLLVNHTCVCKGYTYELTGSPSCLPCNITCYTCNPTSTNICLSCDSTRDHRIFRSSNNTCPCDNGYYDPPVNLSVNPYPFVGAPCLQCQYTCQTCTNLTACVTCNASLNRIINSTSKLCSCLTNFYDDGSNQACIACPYYCLTCIKSTASVICQTCPSTRTQIGGACPCSSGYFDVGVTTCQQCDYSCDTCSSNSSCLTCNSTFSRTMSNGSCICLPGYFDIYGVHFCSVCDVSCASCISSAANSCKTCDGIVALRQLTTNNTCVCKMGYYSISGVAVCSACLYTCQSCVDSSTCANCNASNHRVQSGSSCLCNTKYFDDGGNQLCKSCLYYCLTCTNASSCLTCDLTTRNTTNLSTCSCMTGYFNDGVSAICPSCLTSCATCDNPNNCTSCPIGRILTTLQTCICGARTFQPYCTLCSYSCLTCAVSSLTCTSCNGTAMRFFNSTTSKCNCYIGFYDDLANQTCGTCDFSCLTCLNSFSCQTCPVNRVSNGSYCSCISTYYLNGANLNCLPCHYSCQTCSNSSTVCTSCNSSNFRIASNSTTLCICSNGYYDNQINQLCFPCSALCLTCSAYSTCTSCNSTINLYLSNFTCLCVNGYYFDSNTQMCVHCDSSCSSCLNSISCLVCQSNRTQIPGGLCICNSGYFDNPSTHNCDICSYPCINCITTTSTCTLCDSQRSLDTLLKKCICIGATFDTGLNCSNCLSTCQTCTNGTACVTCLSGSLRVLNNLNLCLCPSGYHDENGTLLICIACHYSCSTCSNSLSCLVCYSGRIPVVGGHCTCPVDLYYDNGVNGACNLCSYRCQSCSKISNNCTACSSTNFRLLNNNSCPCQQSYYDDGSGALCQNCHYSCQQCGNINSCSLCNASNHRVYTTGPFCICSGGYFDVTNIQLCQSCSYKCLTCSSSSTLCLTCSASRTFDGVSACPCNPGFYDAGVSICAPCSYQCSTCNSATTCVTCPSTTRLLDSNMHCLCKNSFYDVNGTLECLACSPICLQCSSYQTCTQCDTATNFRQLINSSCQCTTAYFDAKLANIYICQVCSYSCSTCVSLTQCTSCNINYQRIYNTSTTLCSCAPGYYDNLANEPCILCPSDCLTCISSTQCLTCATDRYLTISNRCACQNSTYNNGTNCQQCPIECSTCQNSSYCDTCKSNRTISVSNACICQVGMYSVAGTALCNACHYSCSSCVTYPQCSSCNSTAKRFLSGFSCFCNAGYYDDLSHQECLPCQYSCLLCSQNFTCLSCNSLNNRIFDSVTQLCICTSGYYEDSVSKICTQCPYNCLTCYNGTACKSCNVGFFRTLNNVSFTCQCPIIGYYDTLISPVCATCHYTCKSCSNSATYCTSCLNTTFRTISVSTCPCSNGYFDIPNQAICQTCSHQCVTCAVTSTACTLCSIVNYRSITPACGCIDGYYDDGSTPLCQTCNYTCQTCINSLTCTLCNLTISRRQLNNITLMCDCIPQYFDSGAAICANCLYSCLTCSHPSQCITCPSTRSLSLTSCLCLPKYYDDASSLECQPCHYSCQNCLNSSTCFSCNAVKMRVYNTSTLLCSCLTGYFDALVQICTKCQTSCYTCSDLISCSSCPLNSNKTINATAGSNFCICLYGYYENVTAGVLLGYNSICSPCYFACQTCSSSSTYCTLCNTSSNRYLTASHQCLCQVSFFEVVNQQLCLPCFTNCLSCFGTLASQCLTCDNTTYYLNNTCYPACPSYYVNAVTPNRICLSCLSHCMSCPVSTSICSQCQATYFIFSYNASYSVCIQNCPTLYYQVNSTCFPCISPCLFCTAAYTCSACIDLFFLKSGSCYPCQNSCLTCNGPTALDCLTCIPQYILKGTVCQKLTCTSTQYVHSTLGCTQCLSTFINSATCLSTGPTTCKDSYLLNNNTCVNCSQVTGYAYDSTTGKCKDKCGDGLIITDLCDDGNNQNGDGCSTMCTVENNWACPNNSCQLLITPTLELVSIKNIPSIHSISLIIRLNVGVRLIDRNFILKFTSITKFNYILTALNAYYTEYELLITYYQSPANNQLSIQIQSPIARLLTTSSLQLTISLSLSLSLPINTSPPAIYISDQQTAVYSKYLMGFVATLHVAIILAIVVTLMMKLKIMLLIIDAFNSLTILYILAGLGLYSISLVSSDSLKGLQPFIYSFGALLENQQTNLSYFDYTQNFFSSCIIQSFVIVFCVALSFIHQIFNKPVDNQNNWYYFRTGCVFAFSYDLLLSCFSTYFWSNYNSYESSYSWMFAILVLIFLIYEGFIYYRNMRHVNSQKKIVPAISFITNDLEAKQKNKNQINIFQFEEQSAKQKKIPSKVLASENSDQKTQVLNGQPIVSIQDQTFYYDLTPSTASQYTMNHSNHINAFHLPIITIFFGLLFSIIINIQTILIRSALLLVLTILYFLFVIFNKNQSVKSIRTIKLIIFSLVYIAIAAIALLATIKQQTINLKNVDAAVVAFTLFGLIANLITFIVNVRFSQAYRQYLVRKKNQQILQRTKRQNEARQKLYHKQKPTTTLKDNSRNNDTSSIVEAPKYPQINQQIQISQEQVQEKELRFSKLKNRQVESRTFIGRQKDSIVNLNIDEQISSQRDQNARYNPHNQNLLNQKNIFQEKYSSVSSSQKLSPNKSRQGNRIRAINNSQMSLISKKAETPSMFLDNTLQRIDEFKGVRKNVGKSKQKEEVAPANKRVKRKKKIIREVDLIDSEEQKIEKGQQLVRRQISQLKGNKIQQKAQKISTNLQQILDEMDMPQGFKQQTKKQIERDSYPQRMMSIDQISSIKEERQQFFQQGIVDKNSQGMNVFNKILQDYKIYKNKKVDKKKLKNLKKKQDD